VATAAAAAAAANEKLAEEKLAEKAAHKAEVLEDRRSQRTAAASHIYHTPAEIANIARILEERKGRHRVAAAGNEKVDKEREEKYASEGGRRTVKNRKTKNNRKTKKQRK
jgi:hypothetical protein